MSRRSGNRCCSCNGSRACLVRLRSRHGSRRFALRFWIGLRRPRRPWCRCFQSLSSAPRVHCREQQCPRCRSGPPQTFRRMPRALRRCLRTCCHQKGGCLKPQLLRNLHGLARTQKHRWIQFRRLRSSGDPPLKRRLRSPPWTCCHWRTRRQRRHRLQTRCHQNGRRHLAPRRHRNRSRLLQVCRHGISNRERSENKPPSSFWRRCLRKRCPIDRWLARKPRSRPWAHSPRRRNLPPTWEAVA
mmetsp:Transcript_114888/g.324719  ORF Transcript_114888/g.324719 Transcript_114888/m.324719 type:complete len:243 (-) Transcript_114888:167-895(-)